MEGSPTDFLCTLRDSGGTAIKATGWQGAFGGNLGISAPSEPSEAKRLNDETLGAWRFWPFGLFVLFIVSKLQRARLANESGCES